MFAPSFIVVKKRINDNCKLEGGGSRSKKKIILCAHDILDLREAVKRKCPKK